MNMRRRTLLAVPAASALRVTGANDSIRIGLIGCGGRGRYLAGLFREFGVDVVAVCDVYETNLAAGRKVAAEGDDVGVPQNRTACPLGCRDAAYR